MTLANWLLGLLALCLWGGVFGWYFWRDVQRMWRGRYDKWFRD